MKIRQNCFDKTATWKLPGKFVIIRSMYEIVSGLFMLEHELGF